MAMAASHVPGDRRLLADPAPVGDQVPLTVNDDVPATLGLDPEDADADNPHREVELWGGVEGPDLVEDATIEVAGLEGIVDLLLGLPLWRVLAAGGECWIEFHDSLLLLIVVSDRADGASFPPTGTRPPQLRSKSW